MKKDNSLLTMILSIIFCLGAIAIDILYWKHFSAFYLACTVISSIAFVISVICFVLKFKKSDSEERYHKILVQISMVSAAFAVLITGIGTLIIMFTKTFFFCYNIKKQRGTYED